MVFKDKYVYIEELENKKWPLKTEELFVFDIDETLYPYSDTIKLARRKKLIQFAEKLGIPNEDCMGLFKKYALLYGSVMKGLVTNHELTPWHKEVLPNPVSDTYSELKEDPSLKAMLSQIDGRKICFTNGGKCHAKEVLTRIGLEDSFELVICCNFFIKNFMCKPQKEAYIFVEQFFSVPRKNIHFFDDKEVNTLAATNLGWNCYLITEEMETKEYIKNILQNSGINDKL